MDIPQDVLDLVKRFKDNRISYRSGRYNETQIRHEFIDPFFESLGWDINNRQGYAEAYKDVIHEDAIRVGEGTKAPDYCFRIGGTRKFFVEAKKPSVDIRQSIHPAYQLRRYAWSAKLPLSVLTDFEEFAVYDCRSRPDQNDKASTGRTMMLTFEEYPGKWAEITGLFSRDAILKGAFDAYAETSAGKRGTAEVDDEFLKDIEEWRKMLALNFALRNNAAFGSADHRATASLNYAVQSTIDRILFLRICEARGIEDYGRLLALTNGQELYARLGDLFRQADERYNSGLFHFHEEKGISEPSDGFTLALQLDDKPLKELIRDLYYPHSPYEFTMISPAILGQVYEQFLGKVIRLTAGGQAKVEEKPEVRKAGGVYYTPGYIVDYIVSQTVGVKLEEQEKKGVGGSWKLRVLDPACGSGSFLITAYQTLLDWYLKEYTKDALKFAKGREAKIRQDERGGWVLTTGERKRILTGHIFGVDIDPQAVEVTKLSLLLKVLEGENSQSVSQQMALFLERALPDLGRNIQCGNSLIGPDFYEGRQMSLLDEETLARVNPFDWLAAFPEVFKDGGFDVVIGNPPYIRIQALKEWAPTEVEFYKRHYISASQGNYDIYVVFLEKGIALLRKDGKLGFILPHKFFNAEYGESLRGLISNKKLLSKIVHFGDNQVFKNATTYTCLIFLNLACEDYLFFEKVNDIHDWRNNGLAEKGKIPATFFSSHQWNFPIGDEGNLFEKLNRIPKKFENVALRIFQGIKTSADKIYIVDEIEREEERVKIYSYQTDKEFWLESDLLHPLVKSGDIKRYRINKSKRLLLFPYLIQIGGKYSLISESILENDYPLIWEYLKTNKTYLENRENGKIKGKGWYGYIYPKNFDVIIKSKIITPDIAYHSSFALDETGELYFTGGTAGGYGILISPEYPREYMLGLLNSKLLEWFLHKIATSMRGGWFSYEARFIRNLPIKIIESSKSKESSIQDKVISLVKKIVNLNKKSPNTPQEKEALKREIEITTSQIDQLVYEIYGLTEEEIRIVEGN